jgi:hypothetical protein
MASGQQLEHAFINPNEASNFVYAAQTMLLRKISLFLYIGREI